MGELVGYYIKAGVAVFWQVKVAGVVCLVTAGAVIAFEEDVQTATASLPAVEVLLAQPAVLWVMVEEFLVEKKSGDLQV